MKRFLHRSEGQLRAGDHSYNFDQFRRVYLVGAGKAAVPMARAVEDLLTDRLEAGIVVVKYGHGGTLGRTTVLEAGHPEPDENGQAAALQLLDFVDRHLDSRDLLLVVISGGGSALLPAPVPPITLAEKQQTTALLLRAGATIQEMNTVRKHLSRIKGGRLVKYAHGATILAMMLSDVVGDELTSIASGPTVPDPTTYTDCLAIITKYGLETQLPAAVTSLLKRGAKGGPDAPSETPKSREEGFEKVQNAVVASNIVALQAAAQKAGALDLKPLILSSSIEGNTTDIALAHVALAREVLSSGNPVSPPCCIISGGETTVKVTGDGKGGRNQEFALCCAQAIADWKDRPVLFASLGSDGTDGPTDAAGAVATPQTVARAEAKGMSVQDFLRRNDSYHFFDALGDLIRTGPTRTNVMDLRLVLIG